MKVLAISSSPRIGGNSDLICDQFLKGAKESGHEAIKINLAKQKISPCFACDICRGNGGVCVQKDDMVNVLQQLIDADVILLASPVYFYSICAQMKTMIDRCYPRYTEIKNKKFYFALTAADTFDALDYATNDLRGFLECLPDSHEVELFDGSETWAKGDVKGKAVLAKAYEAGKNL